MTDKKPEYDYHRGDVLLIKIIKKRIGKPATPSGEVYSEREFYLFGGHTPVYHVHDIGDTVPMRIMEHRGDLSARYADPSKSNKEVFQDWMNLQKKRLGEVTSVVELGKVPDEIATGDTTVEKQNADEKKETDEFDEWTESKSDKMGDLL